MGIKTEDLEQKELDVRARRNPYDTCILIHSSAQIENAGAMAS